MSKQLADFAAAYTESAELRTFLASPAVDRAAKHGVIEKLLARTGGSKIVRNFLFVVIDHQRAHILPEMIAAFQDVVRRREGIAEAEVSSAIELSGDAESGVCVCAGKVTGKRVEAKYSLEPKLLGGAVVRIGDTIYDGSLRSRLDAMRARLVAE